MEQLKPIFSTFRYMELSGAASRFVVEFTKAIRPILQLFGSLDNESIMKYSRCISTKEIYDDHIAKDGNRVNMLKDYHNFSGKDFWALFRAEGCDVKSPEEPGFIFKDLPLAYDADRSKWIKAINAVNNNDVGILDDVLRSESYIEPTPRMQEAYDMVSQFCKDMKAKGWGRKHYQKNFFTYDKDGDLAPNPEWIVFGRGGIN